MAGDQHHFVAGIRAIWEVEAPLGNGRFQPLHMAQEDRDWCGPFALSQVALLLQGWSRQAVTNRQTARDPWRSFWNRVEAEFNNGTDESDLTILAGLLSLRLEVTKTSSARRIGAVAREAVKSGDVPLVRSTTARWSHWSMVSGIAVDADGVPTALLLLDTSLDAPHVAPYNARQQLQPSRSTAAEFRYECHALDGSRWRARFDSIVVVRRDNPREVES